MLFNSTLGNYHTTAYDIFINPILWLVYFILSLILILTTQKQVKSKNLYLILILPVLFGFISYTNGKNLLKRSILEGKIDNYPSSIITFFDNETFEIKIYYPHVTEYKKGEFERIKNDFILKETELVNITDSLYTTMYKLENDSILKPNEKKFKQITVYNNGYK